MPASAIRRPRSPRISAGRNGRAARASRRAVERLGISGSGHSPAGAIAVTERAWPARASSSATQPPSELPATCGRSRPSASSCGSPAARSAGARRVDRRRLAEARHVERDHLALGREALEHRVPHVPVGAEGVQQHERRAAPDAVEGDHEAASMAAVSTAEPPATAAVFGAAPSGSPPRLANVDGDVAQVAADRRHEPRRQRLLAQHRRDREAVQEHLARAERAQRHLGRDRRPGRARTS